jgi:formate dehydrogenase major subunit
MYSLHHHDLGTPASDSAQQVTVEIDGHSVTVPAGTSIMRAAASIGEQIPKLCATDSLKAFGSCRLCLIEIEGRKGYPASCTTQVAEGMKIRTHSEKLSTLRHGVMELYASDHPAELLNGSPLRTEIRDMAHKLGVTGETRYGNDGERHTHIAKDESNPYFTFDPNACIVCSRCVRACDEIQGTLALTVEGRGFKSRVVASQDEPFVESECVSCGACVEACPTTALTEKTLITAKPVDTSTTTTCAYCGVGCSFKAELSEGAVVRMVPNREGRANGGHACVKGRFAYGYATHEDRILKPMIRAKISDPWREVSWDEAIGYAASEFKRIQAKYGRNSVGGITSSRCTNEEAYLVQKLVRAAFGNNNVDTCARVCHSPTGYGLKNTMGESAGTQEFASVMKADAIILIGANPTEGHPVFASQLKRRLRQGAKLIVIDPRQIALVRTPHIEANYHLQLRPGTNVAVMNAIAHVVVTEGLQKDAFAEARCEVESYRRWKEFVAHPDRSPEATADVTGVPADMVRGAARLFASAKNGAIYYGLGVTEHSQGTTTVMSIANLAMATGNLGREGVGVNPLRGQNNVQGSCDMGSFPHELTAYRHISDNKTRALFEANWGVTLDSEPGLRIPNMFEAALDGTFKGMYVEGEDMAQSDPNTLHVTSAFSAMECVVVQDLFLNETAKYAHVFLPGATFLEKDGTFTNAERRISRVRKVIEPRAGYADWEVTCLLSNALGYPMNYQHPSQIMDEIASLTPTFTGVSFAKIDELGSIQWPCNAEAPNGTPTMHIDHFVRGKGKFFVTEYVATSERSTSRFPLLLTTGRILSQYNVGAQTRRTHNIVWHDEDRLEIHPDDAETRGIKTGDWVGIASRAGDTVMRAILTERVQRGVVYTTFHFPESGANVITTESSDWATNCPEYKVTAVQVVKVNQPSEWQKRHQELTERQRKIVREHSVSQF